MLWLGGWESPRSPVRSLSFNSQANSDKTSGSSHSLGGHHSQPWCSSCREFYEQNHTPWCVVSAHLLQHPQGSHFGTSCLLWGQAWRLAAPVPATPWCPCPGQVLVQHAGQAMAGGHLRLSPHAGHISLSKMSSVGGYYLFFFSFFKQPLFTSLCSSSLACRPGRGREPSAKLSITRPLFPCVIFSPPLPLPMKGHCIAAGTGRGCSAACQ